MDGYHANAKGGEFVTYERLRAMGNNGVQEPATGFENGKLVGTKRLFADGKFGTKDGKATFMATEWRGLQAPGKEEESKKFAFLINNGRANHVWQSAYLDQQNDFVMDRWPYPVHPDEPGRHEGVRPFGGRPRRSLQRQRRDAGDGLSDADRKTQADLHAVRLSDGRAGECRLARRQRTDHSELQANLGQHSQDRLGARRRARHELQVLGVQGLTNASLGSEVGSGDTLPEPIATSNGTQRSRLLAGATIRTPMQADLPVLSVPRVKDFQISMRTSMADQLAIETRGGSPLRGPLWTGDHLRSRVGHRSLRFSLRLLHGGRHDVPAEARTPDA